MKTLISALLSSAAFLTPAHASTVTIPEPHDGSITGDLLTGSIPATGPATLDTPVTIVDPVTGDTTVYDIWALLLLGLMGIIVALPCRYDPAIRLKEKLDGK